MSPAILSIGELQGAFGTGDSVGLTSNVCLGHSIRGLEHMAGLAPALSARPFSRTLCFPGGRKSGKKPPYLDPSVLYTGNHLRVTSP